jgi:hypothetical protein
LTRVGAWAALAVLMASGCARPVYEDVGLQVDLQVSESDDPFEQIAGVRVCLSGDAGAAFFLFPRDPGSYLITDIPGDEHYDIAVQGLDREPDEIEAGSQPQVLAHVTLEDAAVALAGESGFVEASFTSCGADCPGDCAEPVTLPTGDEAIGLRRMLSDP